MPTFYLTFGYNTPYRDSYQKIHAPNEPCARLAAFKEHERHWAFLYDEAEFKGQPEQYDLTCLRKELTYEAPPEDDDPMPAIVMVPR